MQVNSLGPFCALGSSVTWALGTTGYSKISNRCSPYSINFVRSLVALPLFLVMSLFITGGMNNLIFEYQHLQLENFGWFILSLVASHGLGDVLFLLSSRQIGVSTALAISSCCPVWNTLAGYFMENQSILPKHCLGLVITLVGLVMVILSGETRRMPEALESKSEGLAPARPLPEKRLPVSGILLAVGTSFLWALNAFASIQGASHLPMGVGNSIQMGMSLISTLLLAKLFSSKSNLMIPFSEVRKNLRFFVIEAFIGNFLYLYGISHSTYAQGLTLASLAPVASIPIGIYLKLEKFCVRKSIGILAVVVGTIFLLV